MRIVSTYGLAPRLDNRRGVQKRKPDCKKNIRRLGDSKPLLSCLPASDHIDAARANTAVWDFSCSTCGAVYQLKSQSRRFGRKVSNSAYGVKMQAIADGRAPHYAFLQYSTLTSRVTDLFVVPGHFLSPAVVEQRAALKDTARRRGWVGSNILIGMLSTEARVLVVEAGVCRDPPDVRDEWGRYRFLAGKRGGWAADVLSCVRVLQQEMGTKEFTLQAFYQRFETELAARHLDNRNVIVQPKIRQQMQVLREGSVLRFLGSGHYRVMA